MNRRKCLAKSLPQLGLLAGAATLACAALAQEVPQPGGTLSIATVFRTVAPMSFDVE